VTEVTSLSYLVHFWSILGIEYTELGRIPFNSEKEQNPRKALIHRNLSEFKVWYIRIRSPSLYPVELQAPMLISDNG